MKAGDTEEDEDDEKGSESSGTFSSDMTGTVRFKPTSGRCGPKGGESRGPTSGGAQDEERQAQAQSGDFDVTARERSLASMIVGQLSCSRHSIASTQQAQHSALLGLSHKLDREVGLREYEMWGLGNVMKNLKLQISEDRQQQQQQVREHQIAPPKAAALAHARAPEPVLPTPREVEPDSSKRSEKWWSETMEIPRTPPKKETRRRLGPNPDEDVQRHGC